MFSLKSAILCVRSSARIRLLWPLSPSRICWPTSPTLAQRHPEQRSGYCVSSGSVVTRARILKLHAFPARSSETFSVQVQKAYVFPSSTSSWLYTATPICSWLRGRIVHFWEQPGRPIYPRKNRSRTGSRGILPWSSFFANDWSFNTPMAGLFVRWFVSSTYILLPPPGDAYLFTLTRM